MLTAKGLRGFCKTSGGLGLHVYVPLASDHSFEQSRAFARSVAAELAAAHGDLVTDRRELASRTGRVLVDWIPNGPRALTVVPDSMRAGDLPTVSTPVRWEEVEAAARNDRADGMRFTPAQVLERTGAAGDLFRPVLELEQTLPYFRALRLG
jgi:bifunctional non-homologous end joining protein LigD